jgi:hypothetical protein
MPRLEVSHDGGSILLVVFFWRMTASHPLSRSGSLRHMCTTKLELQKARRVLARIVRRRFGRDFLEIRKAVAECLKTAVKVGKLPWRVFHSIWERQLSQF